MEGGPRSRIGPDVPSAERTGFGEVGLEHRLRDGLDRLNSDLRPEASGEAFRKLMAPAGTTLEACNLAVHRMLVDGATVEYRTRGGVLRGAQVSMFDYGTRASNDRLAVNQSPWSRASTTAGQTSYCSSMAFRSV